MSSNEFLTAQRRYRARVEEALERCLPPSTETPERLHSAMRYAVLTGGKRIRALLVYATGLALGASAERFDRTACAVELIHAYSLVHDDLPPMDDDDLRRGHPTCHRAYDEATAILVGDALQALAFQQIADDEALPAEARVAMIRELATAAGSRGMVGGQAIDLAAVGDALDLAALERMHALKTGALIVASIRLAALATGASEADIERLARYGTRIGLAFQIQDDVLDVEGDTEVLGKASGADHRHGKPTYPALLGLDEAKRNARALVEDACEALTPFAASADVLRALAIHIVERDH